MYKAKIRIRVSGVEYKPGDTIKVKSNKQKDGVDKKTLDALIEKKYVYDPMEELENEGAGIDDEDDSEGPNQTKEDSKGDKQ